jgi:hypothetical protein
VHPIERLRYVARSSGAPQHLLVRETAEALADLGFDPQGLVTACRRIIERHPVSGPLWWLATRLLTSTDPMAEAVAVADELDADSTADCLANTLPDGATVCVLGWPEQLAEALPRRGDLDVLVVDALGEGAGLVRRLGRAGVDAVEVPMSGLGAAAVSADLVVLEASAGGPGGFVAVAGSRAAAAVARHAEVPVWMVSGVGRLLSAPLWDTMVRRLDSAGDRWDAEDERVPLDLVDRVAGPARVDDVCDALSRIDCPTAQELLRPLA